jgi:xanthine dehydrogenase iron-sulfur cluster and FAD-binding subunit A
VAARTATRLDSGKACIGSPQIRNVATIGGNVANAAACADTLPVLVCLDEELCRSCGLCVTVCAPGALDVLETP